MSWLNFNDSLSNLKGQISNFANTVLADETLDIQRTGEQSAIPNSNELEPRRESKVGNNEFNTGDTWRWSMDESKTDQLKTDETITNLKKRIQELENENRDLITSLDQLDQNHQQNSEELVKMKTKLAEELEIVTEKYEILNMKYNKLALAENAYKKKINELKSKYEELSKQKGPLSQKIDNDDTSTRNKELESENLQLAEKLTILEKSNKDLEILLQDTNLAIDSKLSEMIGTIQQLETEKKALRIALQTKPDTESANNKVEVIEEYQQKIKELEDKIQMLKENECSLIKKDNESNEKLKEYESKINKHLNDIEEMNVKQIDVNNRYQELEKLYTELEKSKNEIEERLRHEYNEQIIKLNDDLLKLSESQSIDNTPDVLLETDNNQSEHILGIHKNYLQILKNNFKEYVPPDAILESTNDIDTISSNFSISLKNILTILGQLELKCSSLEAKIFVLNQAKTDLQNEKNEEIEKLMQNSEMLTQELLKKSAMIKDLEEECSQLMKNNDLLIAKLEEPKETGLQTIFESNEDNLALLEKQLETATKRIFELERMIPESEDKVFESIEETEFNRNLQEQHLELKANITRIENEKKILQSYLDDVECKLHETQNERDNCRLVIDKMKFDFETTEYQFTEMNINLETLSEEIEKHKLRIDSLVSENENLKSLKEEILKKDEELMLTKGELKELKEHHENLQIKVTQLEEKLVDELQLERSRIEELQKDLVDSVEERKNLDLLIEDSSSDLLNLQSDLKKIQDENNNLKDLYFTFCSKLKIKEEGNEYDVENNKVLEQLDKLQEEIEYLRTDNLKLNSDLSEHQEKLQSQGNAVAEKELHDLMNSRNELISIVQTKHQETLTYHAEIQRLSEILKGETEKNIQLENQLTKSQQNSCPIEILNAKNEEIEKLTDKMEFLQQKCEVLAQNMLEEQRKVENEKISASEKEVGLCKKLERLQSHLMEVEEHYTQELLQSEQKIALLQARFNEVEQREKDSSTMYTSVSIRANQQNEALQQQLQSVTNQRDELKKSMMELEDENNVKSAALSNLQLVLEQFQRDKEADVFRETDRIRRQVKQEHKVQEDLRKEISNLETQIKESKQGLQAALRLTDQLEMTKNQISTLKEEVIVLTDKLDKKEEELKTVSSQTDGKVDKSLIKNLIIGFVTSNKNLNKDQSQILKIIATVLDFNEQDHTKVNLNQAQQSNWLKSLLSPMGTDEASNNNESLSRAFVNFLENESKPRVIPSLLPENHSSESFPSQSSSSTTTPTPIVLNEIVLPTFSDFPQHRNSSSILKGVLKDNP